MLLQSVEDTGQNTQGNPQIPVYYCKNQHKLVWKDEKIKSCDQCGDTNNSFISRYMCPICDTKYCVKCKVPPTGQYCGGGHKIGYLESVTNRYCDICSQNITGGSHFCNECEFDICDNCWVELKELAKEQDNKQNIKSRDPKQLLDLFIKGEQSQYEQQTSKMNQILLQRLRKYQTNQIDEVKKKIEKTQIQDIFGILEKEAEKIEQEQAVKDIQKETEEEMMKQIFNIIEEEIIKDDKQQEEIKVIQNEVEDKQLIDLFNIINDEAKKQDGQINEKLLEQWTEAELKQYELQTSWMNRILLNQFRKYQESNITQIQEQINQMHLQQLFEVLEDQVDQSEIQDIQKEIEENHLKCLFDVLEKQTDVNEFEQVKHEIENNLMLDIFDILDDKVCQETLQDIRQEIEDQQLHKLFEVFEQETNQIGIPQIQQQVDGTLLLNLFEQLEQQVYSEQVQEQQAYTELQLLDKLFNIMDEKVLQGEVNETRDIMKELQLAGLFNVLEEQVIVQEGNANSEVKRIQELVEKELQFGIFDAFDKQIDKCCLAEVETMKQIIDSNLLQNMFTQLEQQVKLQYFFESRRFPTFIESKPHQVQHDDFEPIEIIQSQTLKKYQVNVHIRDKLISIQCGDAAQKVKWVCDVAIYIYQQNYGELTPPVAQIQLMNGDNLDANSTIHSTIPNQSEIQVILKDEIEYLSTLKLQKSKYRSRTKL